MNYTKIFAITMFIFSIAIIYALKTAEPPFKDYDLRPFPMDDYELGVRTSTNFNN